MSAKDFGVIADFLESSKNETLNQEFLYRVCAGRHYYEVFHIVKDWLVNCYPQQYADAGGATHQALRTCCYILQKSENEDMFEKLELKLHALHDLRVNADYHLDRKFSSGKLTTMKVEKERIYKLLDSLFALQIQVKQA
ncbi:hypothetical protein M5F04_01565 [Acinetobacter sp. ANC 7200]|uniref:hypothetical protein n=1 Tax=Acinetobacter amyesii TaxID=2942470 RepID=UPI0020BDAB61|nr:hypothetical protein [Acinetobacter amyesii]MCL6243264.1 hypothetical protein [Acinetobacter amyesii]